MIPRILKHEWHPKNISEKQIILRDRVAFWLVDYEKPKNYPARASAYSRGYKILLDINENPIAIYHLTDDKYENNNLLKNKTLSQLVSLEWRSMLSNSFQPGVTQTESSILVNTDNLVAQEAAILHFIKTVGPVLRSFAKHGNAANCMYLKKNYDLSGCRNPKDYRKELVPIINPSYNRCNTGTATEIHMLPFDHAEELVKISFLRPFDYF